MSSVVYNAYKKYAMNGAVDLDTDTIKMMLVTSSYTPDIDAHAFRSSVTNEVTGTGYTAGGATLTTPVVSQDNTNDWGKFTSDAVAWTTATISAAGAVLYKARGGASSADELICYLDLGGTQSVTAGTFTVTPGSNGWLTGA